ncbi:MAG TPA: adenylate/guanylate cyclase domain-containing protein [Acidimicrobiia bacterium]|nr:adenylate/guanylate cyclase domain-containing protein [Acidimicrobiia bacterium]
MHQAMSPDEFASLVGLPIEDVETYRAHGLLDPDGDDLLDDVDLVRLQVVLHHIKHGGHDAESLAEAFREGRVESMFGRQLFDAGSAITLEEAAGEAALEPEQLRQLIAALGFPSNTLRNSDVSIFEVLRAARDAGLPWDAILGVTRVVGDSLRRIAETEIRVVHVYIHERLLAEGVPEEEIDQLIFGIEQNLAPLLDPMLQRLHHEYLLEASVEDAFFHLASSESADAALGSMEATIAFVDIASFTAFAEARGDDAAARVIDRVDAVVRRLLVEHSGKVVKQVGDGFMLAFREPAASVRFAVAVQGELDRDAELPAIRVGINTGPVLYRTGEYLGGAVNVASRVVSSAMAGQILLTEPVAKAASDAGIPVDELGVRMMRGVDDPLALYRVSPTQ